MGSFWGRSPEQKDLARVCEWIHPYQQEVVDSAKRFCSSFVSCEWNSCVSFQERNPELRLGWRSICKLLGATAASPRVESRRGHIGAVSQGRRKASNSFLETRAGSEWFTWIIHCIEFFGQMKLDLCKALEQWTVSAAGFEERRKSLMTCQHYLISWDLLDWFHKEAWLQYRRQHSRQLIAFPDSQCRTVKTGMWEEVDSNWDDLDRLKEGKSKLRGMVYSL